MTGTGECCRQYFDTLPGSSPWNPPKLLPRVPTTRIAGSYRLICLSLDVKQATRPRKTNHVVDNFVNLTDGKLQYQIDRLVVMISTLYVGHGVVSLHTIPTSLYAAVSCYCILLLDHSETYYFITVVDELVDEPL